MIGRRGFVTGLISLVAAPAIVRAGSLMPVKVMPINTDLAFLLSQDFVTEIVETFMPRRAISFHKTGDVLKLIEPPDQLLRIAAVR